MGMITALATSLGTALGFSAAAGSGLGAASAAATAGAVALDVGMLGVAGAATSGVLGGISSIRQVNAAQEQADYAAKISERNEQMYKDQEQQILDQGAFELRQQKLKQAGVISDAQASAAANGVMLGSGSLVDWEVSANEVFEEDNRQLSYDIQNRAHTARIGAWNARNNTNAYNARSDAFSEQKPLLYTAGAINTTSDTFSTGLNLYSTYGKITTAKKKGFIG